MANKDGGLTEGTRWDNENSEVTTERDVERVIEDEDSETVADLNARPGLLNGAPFIPPVSFSGPSVGGTSLGMGDMGVGTGGLPIPVVPVLEPGENEVETGVLVNPFTPADPDNDKPFRADIGSPADLSSRVEVELASDGRFSQQEITILNNEGVIRLEGAVSSRQIAEDIASTVERVPGVRGVENHLTVD